MTSVTSSHWTLGSFSQRKQAWPCLPGFVWSRRCRTDCKRKGEKRASLQTFSLSVSSKFPELEKVISGFLIEFCNFLFYVLLSCPCCRNGQQCRITETVFQIDCFVCACTCVCVVEDEYSSRTRRNERIIIVNKQKQVFGYTIYQVIRILIYLAQSQDSFCPSIV